MDLSKSSKNNRDRVEEPLFLIEQILDDLEECGTRIDAAMAVWPETARTLQPARRKQQAAEKRLAALKEKLAALWKQGYRNKWK
jgi:exonuclease VII small subunit